MNTHIFHMLHRNMAQLAAVALLGFAMAACGGSNSSDAESVEDQLRNTHLMEALQQKDIARATLIADSLALDVDDLSNNESVAVLLAYLEIHNDASRAKDSKRDLETLRKFVDVYELSMARDSHGMEEAIEEARSINPEVDLSDTYRQFRSRLAEYDAVNGEELTQEAPQETDSVAATTDSIAPAAESSNDIPVEYRPAD